MRYDQDRFIIFKWEFNTLVAFSFSKISLQLQERVGLRSHATSKPVPGPPGRVQGGQEKSVDTSHNEGWILIGLWFHLTRSAGGSAEWGPSISAKSADRSARGPPWVPGSRCAGTTPGEWWALWPTIHPALCQRSIVTGIRSQWQICRGSIPGRGVLWQCDRGYLWRPSQIHVPMARLPAEQLWPPYNTGQALLHCRPNV